MKRPADLAVVVRAGPAEPEPRREPPGVGAGLGEGRGAVPVGVSSRGAAQSGQKRGDPVRTAAQEGQDGISGAGGIVPSRQEREAELHSNEKADLTVGLFQRRTRGERD